MAWRRPGDKPLSEPRMESLLTHICVTRLQWVNTHMKINFSPENNPDFKIHKSSLTTDLFTPYHSLSCTWFATYLNWICMPCLKTDNTIATFFNELLGLVCRWIREMGVIFWDHGLCPIWFQAIIWINADLSSVRCQRMISYINSEKFRGPFTHMD